MKKLNQRGALDMMFVVLLVVLLAFGGFVVWRVTAVDNETADSAVSTQAGSNSKPTSDSGDGELEEAEERTIPEGWIIYQSTADGFSFAYPEEWGEVTEFRGGPGYENCVDACGEEVSIAFNDLDLAFEIKGRTIDYHLGRGSSDLNLNQKGYVLDGEIINAYGYSTVTERGQAPETNVIDGEVKTNANSIEYIFQMNDLSENQFVSQEFDVSNVRSALFNLAENESGINGLAISAGVTSDSEAIFEQLVDTITFN